MQRGMNDNVEPDRSNKGPDQDDRENIDAPTSASIENEDEDSEAIDSMRVNRTDDSGLTGKDAPDGLTQTDDVIDEDDELDDEDSDVLEPIESGEAG